MDAILKTLSLVMNKMEEIKQLNMREYSAHFDLSLNCYVRVIYNSTVPSSLTSCIQNVVDIFRDAVGGGRVVRWCWVNFQCRGVLQFGSSRARAYCARSRCGWGLFGRFYSHLSFLSSFSLSLGDGPI